jgi:hypothetical protein
LSSLPHRAKIHILLTQHRCKVEDAAAPADAPPEYDATIPLRRIAIRQFAIHTPSRFAQRSTQHFGFIEELHIDHDDAIFYVENVVECRSVRSSKFPAKRAEGAV